MARPRITAPLLIFALGALAIIIAAAAAGWLVIDNLEAQNRSSSADAGILADIAAVDRLSGILASEASAATNGRMTPESMAEARTAIAGNEARLAERLTGLEGRGHDGRVERIRQQADLLTANASGIEDERPALLEAVLAGERSWQQLLFSTNRKLLPAISSSLDNQFYYMMTGRSDFRDAGPGASGTLSEEEYLRYWHLATLMEWTFSAHRSLLAANLSSQDDPTRLANNEESFDTAAQRMEHSIAYLAEKGGPDMDPEVILLANRLLAAGAGEDSALNAMRLRASMADRERKLIGANRQILAGLQGEVDGLAAEVRQSSAAAAGRHGQAASNGRIIILGIAAVGIVATLLAAGYYGFRRRGISAFLAVSSLGALAIIIAAAVAGWLVIDNLEAESRGRGDVEVLAAAAEITRRSSALAATASAASNARMTPESMAGARAAIASDEAELAGLLADLEGRGHDGSVERIGQQVNLLTANAARIEDERPALVEAILAGERNWQDLSLSTNYELFPAIGSSLDNQFYYMMTGRSDFRDGSPPGLDRLSNEEFLRYWQLATLMESVSRGYWTLDFANRLTVPALAARVEETFDTAAQRMERSIGYLAEKGGPDLNPEVIPLASRLLDAGAGKDSALEAMKLRTSMGARERRRIGANRQILAGLQGEVDGLVAEVRQSSAAAAGRYGQAASNGRIIILVIAAVGIAGTLLAAGYNSVRGQTS